MQESIKQIIEEVLMCGLYNQEEIDYEMMTFEDEIALTKLLRLNKRFGGVRE
ncbi:MAG: hypothetical protein R2685_11015 [Candidatus Nitrosocosmicus sp.]|nr:hypothetical protein [Candidatus Nitrosocosmicus sp.]